jgi:uncharacterized protein (TIGR02594 family)
MLFDTAPVWFQSALHELGVREIGNNAGPAIQRYIDAAKCGAIGDPWCAIFVNAMLEANGIPGTRSPSSQSFLRNENFSSLGGMPALGCIVVFWRGHSGSGLGHVGFYRGETADHIYTLGGNEGDMVQIEPFPKKSATFGYEGYFWPESIDLPTARGPIIMPAGTPIHQTDPGAAGDPLAGKVT